MFPTDPRGTTSLPTDPPDTGIFWIFQEKFE